VLADVLGDALEAPAAVRRVVEFGHVVEGEVVVDHLRE
jgi:hypothetical protein